MEESEKDLGRKQVKMKLNIENKEGRIEEVQGGVCVHCQHLSPR